VTRAARGLAAHSAGLAAEDIAARRYEAMGFDVVARRWRAPEGEIDLVARLPGMLVFVEVKSGRGAARRDTITERQWRRLEAAALRYMMEHQTGDIPTRFDAAFIGREGAVDVVENARTFEAW